MPPIDNSIDQDTNPNSTPTADSATLAPPTTAPELTLPEVRREVVRLIAQLDQVVDAHWPDEMDERARDLRDVRLGLWWLGERLRDSLPR